MKLMASMMLSLDGVLAARARPRRRAQPAGYPVIVGDGMRLFPEQGQSHSLELVDSHTTKGGVVFQTYRPVGRATFGTAG